MNSTYRFADRDAAEHWADEHGGTVEYREAGARIVGVDDFRPYVVVMDDDVEVTSYRDRKQADPFDGFPTGAGSR